MFIYTAHYLEIVFYGLWKQLQQSFWIFNNSIQVRVLKPMFAVEASNLLIFSSIYNFRYFVD
jgi:hypothetical protein